MVLLPEPDGTDEADHVRPADAHVDAGEDGVFAVAGLKPGDVEMMQDAPPDARRGATAGR